MDIYTGAADYADSVRTAKPKSTSGGSTKPTRRTGVQEDSGSTGKSGKDAWWQNWLAIAADNDKAIADMERKQKTLAEFTAQMNTEQGRNYSDYFGSVRIESEKAKIAQASNAQEAANLSRAAMTRLAADYDSAGKTISGGWRQACIEMRNAGIGWRNSFTTLLNGFQSAFATAFKTALATARGVFNAIDKFATTLFQNILSAFLDLIAQVMAKLAVLGLLDLFGFGTGGLVGGLILGSRAAGGPIPQTGLYKMHAGEYVLPASVVSAIKAGSAPSGVSSGRLAVAGTGGMNITLNAPITLSGGLGTDTDIRSVCQQLTAAMKAGVSWAIENARTSYKVGARHDGEAA